MNNAAAKARPRCVSVSLMNFCGELNHHRRSQHPNNSSHKHGFLYPRCSRHCRRIKRDPTEQNVSHSFPAPYASKPTFHATQALIACSLYVRGLHDKLSKEDLKRNLYMLFATYGVILDVVVMKNSKMRGQAHVVFRDLDASTQAMRALQGFTFFGKDMVRTIFPSAAGSMLKAGSKSHTQNPSQTRSQSSTARTKCQNPNVRGSRRRQQHRQ